MVNGKWVIEFYQLYFGYWIILGDFYIFRFNYLFEVCVERQE